MVVDAYPTCPGPLFEELAGAAISVWVRSDREHVDDLVRASFAEEGWTFGNVLERATVTRATYRATINGRREFLQALRDGLSAHVHRCERDFLPLDDARLRGSAFDAEIFAGFM